MIKKTILGISLAASLAFGGGQLLPNNELQLSLLAQAAQQKLVVLANMHLKGETKERFGNLYDAYQKDLMQVRLERLKLIEAYAKDYRSMSDEKASKLLDQWMGLQRKELELKEKYIARFKQVLPASLVIRFYQIDNRLSLLREAKVSALIPLAIPEQVQRMKIETRSKPTEVKKKEGEAK